MREILRGDRGDNKLRKQYGDEIKKDFENEKLKAFKKQSE